MVDRSTFLCNVIYNNLIYTPRAWCLIGLEWVGGEAAMNASLQTLALANEKESDVIYCQHKKINF